MLLLKGYINIKKHNSFRLFSRLFVAFISILHLNIFVVVTMVTINISACTWTYWSLSQGHVRNLLILESRTHLGLAGLWTKDIFRTCWALNQGPIWDLLDVEQRAQLELSGLWVREPFGTCHQLILDLLVLQPKTH